MQGHRAFHENSSAFGPCEGPTGDPDGGSFFCLGYGTARDNPLDPFAAEIILCFPCYSHREGIVIRQNLESVWESMEQEAAA